jgi:ABC-type sugar transport system ATPase subunit
LRKISVGLVLNETMERVSSERYLADLRVKAPSSETDIDHLSGGNQQKVLSDAGCLRRARILLLDDPTGAWTSGQGRDLRDPEPACGRRHGDRFRHLELPEVFGISDRILVMHEGRIAAEFEWQQASEKKIIQYAAGNA